MSNGTDVSTPSDQGSAVLNQRDEFSVRLHSLMPLVMAGLWLFIGAVAAYDVYLSVKYHETLRYLELNPLGKLLIELDCGNVAVFMGLKCFGTLSALGMLQFLYGWCRRWALLVAGVVAGGQALLALFLTFG